MRRAPDVGDWVPIKAPDGYELEMDVSHPHGRLRHRLLPDGKWREGNVPVDPSVETGAARDFREDLDGRIK